MQIASLPVLDPSASLSEALDVMRRQKRPAVVVQDGGEHWLILGGDIAAARRGGLHALSEIAARQKVAVLGDPTAGQPDVDRQKPWDSHAAVADFLAGGTEQFAVTAENVHDDGTRMATIVARSAAVAFDLDMPGVYECNGTRATHDFPSPSVQIGQVCPLCAKGTGPAGADATIATRV